MTDSRSERLRRRRNESKNRSATADTDEEATPEQSEGRESPSTGEDEGDISIKEEQIGTYMYLPESQSKALRRQYNILKAEYEFEYDEDFEKNRHFYPLVVKFGLDGLEGMDASDIRECLEDISG